MQPSCGGIAMQLKHLLEIAALLQSEGVGLRSLCESIDTTTPAGRLTFHVLGSVAQFERDLLVERTNAGLGVARSRGRTGGRPRLLTDEKLTDARRLYDEGRSVSEIARADAVEGNHLPRHSGGQGQVGACVPVGPNRWERT